MAFRIDTVTAAANTSTGLQTFTGVLGGLVPTAYILTVTRGIIAGTEAIGGLMSQGFSDGTSNSCLSTYNENGVTTTDTGRACRADACIYILGDEVTTIEGIAVHSSFSNNTVTINWTDAPDAAYIVTCKMFAGVSAKVITWDSGAIVDTNVDVNGVGFQANFLYVLAPQREFSGNNSNAKYCTGVAIENNSTIIQGNISGVDDDAESTSSITGRIDNTIFVKQYTNTGGNRWTASWISFDSDGGIFQKHGTTAGDTEEITGLFLQFPTDEVNMLFKETPTSNGNQATTGMGFLPEHLMMFNCFDTAYVSDDATGLMASPSFAEIGTNYEFSNYWTSEDNVSTTRCRSAHYEKASYIRDDGGTLQIEGEYVSMDADGYTINYTTTDGTARKNFVIGFKDQGALPTGSSLVNGGIVKDSLINGRLIS